MILLKPFLKSGRLEVWADKYIQTGDDWRREIDGRLARAKIGVLLVSPEFAASDFITEVELPAVLSAANSGELTVLCVPIRTMVRGVTDMLGLSGYQWARPPDQPLDPLPEAERHAALVTIVDDLVDRFGKPATPVGVEAAVVTAPVQALVHRPGDALGTLHGVPDLPPHFQPRHDALETLKRAVLLRPQQRFGISAATRTGIHGRGGLGKTVLATALAHDPEIRQAFPDGVYWVTLGQQPGLLALQAALARQAGGKDPVIRVGPAGRHIAARVARGETLPAGSRRRVGGRARDGVRRRGDGRSAAHHHAGSANPDRPGGRDPRLDALDLPGALSLLASWAGAPPPLPAEASRIATECGRLPLALALAGAQVREGVDWKEVLAALERGNLQFLDHPHGSVFKSMSSSIQALAAGDAARYRELAIFPEDVAVPESVITRLWSRAGLDALATTKLLLALHGRGLLRCTGESGARSVTFHDLQGDFLRLTADDLPGLHARLLDAYAETLPGKGGEPKAAGWATLPREEGYLWDHLGRHLLEAGRAAVFDALARNVHWLSAKIAASGVAALLLDLALLVKHAPTDGNRVVEKAVRLESGWLYRDPEILAGQLYNRLVCEGLTAAQITKTVADLHPPVRLVHPVGIGGSELRVFRGHSDGVSACAYSPDGSRILSASDDKTLREWDRSSGKELRRYEGHSSSVTACAYSPDGSRILSASDDKTLREWERSSGKELRRYEGHSSSVTACAYSPDGSRILSASGDKTLREWDRSSGKELRRYEGHSSSVTACAYSPDGSRILSASWDKTLREWERSSGKELRRYEGHSSYVTACAYSPDGSRILSASGDQTLREWERSSGKELRRYEGHSSYVTACAYSLDGSRILSASFDDTLREWERSSGKELRRYEGHSSYVTACAYSPDGFRILSASFDDTLREWERSSGKELRRSEGHFGYVTACAYSSDGSRILSASWDKTLREWDRSSGKELRRYEGDFGYATACAYSPDGSRILSASDDDTLREWERSSGKELRRYEGHSDRVTACAYSSDGFRILSASDDKTLRERDRSSGKELRCFEGHSSYVTACAYSPDGSHILSASDDDTLREWSAPPARSSAATRATPTGSPPARTHRTAPASSRLPGTKPCASGTAPPARSSAGTRATPTGSTTGAYSPDGSRILSAYDDGTIRIWNREDGHLLQHPIWWQQLRGARRLAQERRGR